MTQVETTDNLQFAPTNLQVQIDSYEDELPRPKTLLEKSREIANQSYKDIYSMIQYSIDEQRKNARLGKRITTFKRKTKKEVITDYKVTPLLDPDEIPVEININALNDDAFSTGSQKLLIDDI